jgi:hypothetical protein
VTEAVVAPARPGEKQRWFGPGVAGIGTASLLPDVGHEVPTARLPSLLTSTLRAPAAALKEGEPRCEGWKLRLRSTGTEGHPNGGLTS